MRNIGHPRPDEQPPVAAFRRPEPFSVEIVPDDRRMVVVPHGEVDLDTVGAIAAEIDELVVRGSDRIVIDLRATSFMDSSGVHLLLDCTRRDDARITVIDGSPPVCRVLDVAGVRHLLRFETVP